MIYSSDKFLLNFNFKGNKAWGEMFLLSMYTYTSSYPRTVNILKKKLPSILNCQCFNELSLPFSEEVKNTEIAHLFEHIMIENVCIYGLKHTQLDQLISSGRTSWIKKDLDKKHFRIELLANYMDKRIFEESLFDSINLLEEIVI